MIEVKNLSVSIGKNDILEDISLCAPDGEITVFLGRNGSGKTTLMRTMAGLIESYSGSCLLDGKEVREIPGKDRTKLISFLPQHFARPAISIVELVSLGRAPFTGLTGRLSKEDEEYVSKAVEETGLENMKQKLVCHISGGERQLAYFAMTLAQSAGTMILDEPTASLDVENRKKIFSCIETMKKEGKAIILSLHDVNDAVRYADRVCILEDGTTVFSGTKHDLIDSGALEHHFGLTRLDVKDCGYPVYVELA